jgi:hypothetical protein
MGTKSSNLSFLTQQQTPSPLPRLQIADWLGEPLINADPTLMKDALLLFLFPAARHQSTSGLPIFNLKSEI